MVREDFQVTPFVEFVSRRAVRDEVARVCPQALVEFDRLYGHRAPGEDISPWDNKVFVDNMGGFMSWMEFAYLVFFVIHEDKFPLPETVVYPRTCAVGYVEGEGSSDAVLGIEPYLDRLAEKFPQLCAPDYPVSRENLVFSRVVSVVMFNEVLVPYPWWVFSQMISELPSFPANLLDYEKFVWMVSGFSLDTMEAIIQDVL